ncbi:MAG: hypothetical protein RLZZ127_2662, partial [Planctomycetota bacterium]
MTTMLRALSPAVLLVLSVGRPMPAADPSAAAVEAAWPDRNGLAVQVGAADAGFLAGLTGGNGRLVHGLVHDDALRDRLRGELHRQGIHPLATVATWHDAPRLPYADRLVNLLIIDRDDLGVRAPSADEARRVVAPGGMLLQRAGGDWTATRIERPATQGDWTHYDGGADGNSVGDEQEVTALRTWQWIDNYRDLRWEKTGPHGGDGGNIRVWGRYAVWDYAKLGKDITQSSKEADKGYPDLFVLECRDAANGLPIWRRDGRGGTRGKRRSLAVDQGLVFTWLTDGGPLSALDIASGAEVRTYPGSEIRPFQTRDHNGLKTRPGPYGDSYWVRVVGDRVVANGDGTVRAWTLDGKPLWSFGRPVQRVELPVVDAAAKTVYAVLIPELPVESQGSGISWGRWPASERVTSVIALDLDTGKLRWENTDLASRDLGLRDTKRGYQARTGISVLLPAGKHLIVSNNASISGGRTASVASIDAATGRTVHYDPRQMLLRIRNDKDPKNQTEGELQWMGSLYQCLTRDGKVYLMGASMMYTFDPVGGAIEQVFNLPWNARCIRPVATRTAFLLGQTALIGGKDFSGEMIAVARSGCALSPVPAAGVVMFGPHTCGCTTHFDGFLALSPRAAPPALGEDGRLVKPGPPAVPVPAAGEPPASPAARSWPWFTISESVRPQTITAGGWSFAIDPQRHRVDATGPGRSWSWVA